VGIIEEALSGSRGEDQQRIAQKGIDWLALLLRKNSDYGSSAWKEPVLCPGVQARMAILVRMSDKVERIQSLQKKMADGGEMEVLGESFDDTISDLGSYALLYLTAPEK
jgi:hypothetical protein